MTQTRVRGPAGALAVDDGGRGPPVVFLHSLTGDAAHWQAQLEHLRPRHRAIAVELRGHGGSDAPPDGDYTIGSMADDVAAAVDALGLDRFALVGHSMGGGVALRYAGLHPERVGRLLLLDPIGDGSKLPAEEVRSFLTAVESPAYTEVIESYWAGIGGPSPAVQERLLRDLRATPRETVVAVLRETVAFDPSPSLARYHGPALAVVTPANDGPASLHRVGDGMAHEVITETGHWIQLDRPDELNRILDRFLSG